MRASADVAARAAGDFGAHVALDEEQRIRCARAIVYCVAVAAREVGGETVHDALSAVDQLLGTLVNKGGGR